MNQNIKTFTVFDALIIAFFIVGGMYSVPFIQNNLPETIAVYIDNTLYGKYPLDIDKQFTVKGYEGDVVITIQDHKACVHKSSCRKQVCVKGGFISKSYQQLVCAPNHVLVEICSHDKSEEKIDAITK